MKPTDALSAESIRRKGEKAAALRDKLQAAAEKAVSGRVEKCDAQLHRNHAIDGLVAALPAPVPPGLGPKLKARGLDLEKAKEAIDRYRADGFLTLDGQLFGTQPEPETKED